MAGQDIIIGVWLRWCQVIKWFIEEGILKLLEVKMRGVGMIIASKVQDGSFGAYTADDDWYDYYVVKWDITPLEAEKYEVVHLGEE